MGKGVEMKSGQIIVKLVTKWTSTDASVHDSQAFEAVLRSPDLAAC